MFFAGLMALGAAHFATVFARRAATISWYAAYWACHMRAMLEDMADGGVGTLPGLVFGAGHTCFGAAVVLPFVGLVVFVMLSLGTSRLCPHLSLLLPVA